MQEAHLQFELEAQRRLPEILGELLDEPPLRLRPQERLGGVPQADFVSVDQQGRRWIFEVKGSSRPGIVTAAARQLEAFAEAADLAVLVVPYMTRAGSEAAAERDVNWVDLSGNASLRTEDRCLYVSVSGHPNRYPSQGRPSSPFAAKSARVTRTMLLDPSVWWRQKDLAEATGLDDGHVSRIVRRLKDELMLASDGPLIRPRDPDLLLDAWRDDYRFDRHRVLAGHVSGAGVELARHVESRLAAGAQRYGFTGLAAAWAIDGFARFRLVTVYVPDDARAVAEALEMSLEERGANVQLVVPEDDGVLAGSSMRNGLLCVSAPQVYLDLRHLPERADEAAAHLRDEGLLWHGPA
jgi:hypothetical protein